MKINEYMPYLSLLFLPAMELIPLPEITDHQINFISDIEDLVQGNYILSLVNPKCTIPKNETKNFGQGAFIRQGDNIKYYLPNAIIHVGRDSVEDVATTIINSCNHAFDLINNNAPHFAPYFIKDVKFTLNALFLANGLNHRLPIS